MKLKETGIKLLSRTPKFGGLGIPTFSEISDVEYENSTIITEDLRNKIVQ